MLAKPTCLLLAQKRLRPFEIALSSELDLLRNLQSVIYLNTEISHGALQFGMSEQYLNGPQIPGLAIDLRRFGSPQRMGTIQHVIETGAFRPTMHDPRILPGRQVSDASGPPDKEKR